MFHLPEENTEPLQRCKGYFSSCQKSFKLGNIRERYNPPFVKSLNRSCGQAGIEFHRMRVTLKTIQVSDEMVRWG